MFTCSSVGSVAPVSVGAVSPVGSVAGSVGASVGSVGGSVGSDQRDLHGGGQPGRQPHGDGLRQAGHGYAEPGL